MMFLKNVMYFNSNQDLKNDTIAAIATAVGEGAISVVRISGKDALKIANKIFSRPVDKYKSHTAHVGKILDSQKKVIDNVLLLLMLSPSTYTGEDCVEIHCHGGHLIPQKVLARVLEAGARVANPGEFTLRSFMNKKIDLLQAEAVQTLISANNELALSAAEKQLEGLLSKTISDLQNRLLEIAAQIEAWVDFPEEDLEFENKEIIIDRLMEIQKKMHHLSNTFHEGKILFEGLTISIIGTPNVGKSSLLNALCQKQRAIVSEIAGTTRDTLEENVLLGNLHYKLIDTAGIRKTTSPIELEGISRSKQALEEADFVLLVLDASRDLSQDDFELLEKVKSEKTLIVWNKIDLKEAPSKLNSKNTVSISLKENMGLDRLKEELEKMIFQKGSFSKEEIFLTKARHKEAILGAIEYSQNAIDGLKKNYSMEFIASDVRFCLNQLSTIIGIDVTEDILTNIFSKFCIGK
jgi:tRNA modification GTPase